MLGFWDIGIVLLYLVGVLWVGLRSGRKEENTTDYVAGGRNIPAWAVLASIVATEVSAMTFLNVPGVAFSGNLAYLQTTAGSLLARFFVAGLFIGAFYHANCLTIYEYLATRFGNRTRLTASVFFIITRLIGSGIRLLVAVVALSVILDIPFALTLIGFAVFAFAYAGRGGIRAVIYTDCVQALVFIAGGCAVFYFLINQVGWTEFLEVAGNAGKLDCVRLTPDVNTGWASWFNDAELLYVAALFGFLSTTAAMGTDQDMTQRMLTCKNASESRKSLILSGFAAMSIAGLFLLIGSALFVYYQSQDPASLPYLADGITPDANRIFPHFIATALPEGLKGLLIAGVLAASMSSLDSAMAALSSSSVIDLIKPLTGNRLSEKQLLKLSRILMAVFAAVLALIAWGLRDVEQSFLWLSFKLAGIPYSALLGVFLLGLTTKRGSDRSNLVAMLSGGLLVGVSLYLSETGVISVAWPWCLFAGTLWTFALGALGSITLCKKM